MKRQQSSTYFWCNSFVFFSFQCTQGNSCYSMPWKFINLFAVSAVMCLVILIMIILPRKEKEKNCEFILIKTFNANKNIKYFLYLGQITICRGPKHLVDYGLPLHMKFEDIFLKYKDI